MVTKVGHMDDPSARRPRWVYGVGSEPDPRFSLANERTLLSWIRTSTGFAAGGGGVLLVRQLIGQWALLISVGAFSLSLAIVTGAVWRWARMERALRLERPLPAPMLAGGVAVGLAIGAGLGLLFNSMVGGS